MRLSIKRLFVFASLALVLFVSGGALLSVFVAWNAEQRLDRALRSYEQLAIATGLETDAVRSMLAELQRRAGGDLDKSLFSDRERVAVGIDALIARTQEEIGSTRDAEEQAQEAQEFVAAFALREDYTRLFRALDANAAAGPALDAGVLDRYRVLAARLDEVLSDERAEVAAVISELDALRKRAVTYAALSIALAILAIGLALLFVARFLIGPFRALEAGSSELAEGNIAHRIALAGPPELRRLAERLNEMASRLEAQRNALREHNERLEEVVTERTGELADKAERLQRIDDSRRLFFAKVGHELRTPLAVLLGEAEVALQAPAGGEDICRDALEHIRVHGEQLGRRVADLLTLARADDGRLAVEPARVDLIDLSRETVDAARSYARVNEVTLTLRANRSSLEGRVDADRVRQALMALIDNAIKFSPAQGDIEVRVDEAADWLRLEVGDRGPGVDENQLPQITRAYFSSEGRGSERGSRAGTGLGLAVAQWIADQHGGRLEARNREGGGLVVGLLLPRTAAEVAPETVAKAVAAAGAYSLSSAP
ncbi:MAG: HAMP domain-containing sensor histidine kinase [Halieaceae bacterium]|jgi:signal transduction histidine kinase|nr:HAMP domain-containing sensor histidine kinase [Halieaceae bacterium]